MIPSPLPLAVFVIALVISWSLLAAYSYRNGRHL